MLVGLRRFQFRGGGLINQLNTWQVCMSAKRDKSMGFSFIINGREHVTSAEMANSSIYEQFNNEGAHVACVITEEQGVDELEFISEEIKRHLHNGQDWQTVMLWAAEDLMRLEKKAKGK